ncbi:MAG: DsrE family protein [Ottowia sp.]|nr:DsrE family protein [Ottowia sp.]
MGVAAAPADVDGVAILLWSADPHVPERLATPFFHAAAAAAMDCRVEMYFTAGSVRLLVPGVAAALHASPRHDKSIWDNMREAVALGAQLYACTDALRAHGLEHGQLVPECQGHGGAVQFMARAMDLRWQTLVF